MTRPSNGRVAEHVVTSFADRLSEGFPQESMTTVLHVEDDELLVEAVRATFQGFGFRGTCLAAHSVEEARVLLANPGGPTVNLILSDMSLPDGTGLDIVRTVRSNPVRANVPIVILSGNTDPRAVDQSYVLGANAYIGKSERGRSLGETIGALYAHWLRDVHLPSEASSSRTQRFLARASGIQSQKAAIYIQMAERLGIDHGALWMDLALRCGNLANLFAFLSGRLEGRELPAAVLDEAEAAQGIQLREIEDLMEAPVRTQADAQRYMLAVVSHIRVDIFDRAFGLMFPNPTVATTALRNVIGTSLDQVASWIDSHATDPVLRREAPRLHSEANTFRSSP
jgi:CheY-like chemotaxis protein